MNSPVVDRALAIADGCPEEFLSRMSQLTALRDELRTRRKLPAHQRKAVTALANACGNLAMRLFNFREATQQ